jgi:hypothetical protein
VVFNAKLPRPLQTQILQARLHTGRESKIRHRVSPRFCDETSPEDLHPLPMDRRQEADGASCRYPSPAKVVPTTQIIPRRDTGELSPHTGPSSEECCDVTSPPPNASSCRLLCIPVQLKSRREYPVSLHMLTSLVAVRTRTPHEAASYPIHQRPCTKHPPSSVTEALRISFYRP